MADWEQHSSGEDETGFHHLPIRPRRDSRLSDIATDKIDQSRPTKRLSKRFPESLQFQPSAFRQRSPTQSSIASSASSALFPDSATIDSVSTFDSSLSGSYAHEVQELFAAHKIDDSVRSRRIFHRHQPSSGSSFTFVNDDDDERAFGCEFPHIKAKLEKLEDSLRDREVEALSRPASPTAETPIKDEDGATPCALHDDDSPSEYSDEACTPRCDNSSTASEDLSSRDADGILDYTLQLVYGMDLHEAAVPSGVSRQLVETFVRDIGHLIWQTPSDSQTTGTMSGSSSSSTPSQGGGAAGNSQRGEKRKKEGRSDEEGEDFSDGEGSGYLAPKRTRPNPREEENLRLSCPFRKRNPHRFNVRDHHSCAMTYFPKFAELRQHIVKQHKRDDPSAFVCDRCNRDFVSRKELRDHQRLPREQMCEISDHDPESGIDGPTANKLLSRKRASGSSPEVQWREIWNILFPDDDDRAIHPYHYTPVIEHFELSTHFMTSFKFLEVSLRDKIQNQTTLETLAAQFHECFAETVEHCIAQAQNMPYTNRSNKRNEPARVQNTQYLVARKQREIVPRPDSGVVIDDGSEESGSVVGSALRHKDSVRTVIKRNSQPLPDVSEDPPAVVSSSGVFDENLLRQYSATPAGVENSTCDTAALQAWSSGVMMPPFGSHDGVMTEQFFESGILTPQPEFSWTDPLYQTNFTCMGERFSGFNG